ncbi:MAG: amidohydrolase [Candidatus Binatia bacterium]|nr:amidohydrolase [Candidatus Binatia bacterium]
MGPITIIDADAHMCEPPNLWVERLDRRFRDRAPRVVKNPDGKKGAFFVCENLPPLNIAGAFAAGKTFDKAFLEAGLENALPGGWDPAARLKDMELDGVEAAVLYTTVGFVLFRLSEAAFQEACFRVYNDWLAEFCRYAPQRFAGLALISLFDVERGRQELERCRTMGLRGAMIWASPPEERPYSSPEYDPFWAAAQDLEMPLSLHLATGRRRESDLAGRDQAEFWVNSVVRPHEIQHSLLTLIFSGVLERFPRLRVVSAENDIAWVPHLLERADKYYRRWKEAYHAPLSLKPSEYFRRQCYATFIEDPLGLAIYQRVGVDNIMWSTDYPHQAATWPHSQEVLAREFRHIPEADVRKIVRENAAQLYGFPLA